MKTLKNSKLKTSLRIKALIAKLVFCVAYLVAGNLAFGQLNQGTARWWTGTSGDYKPGTAGNWTNSAGATGAPASVSGDIAIWDTGGLTGNIAGNVLQVTNAAGNSSNPGETLQVTGNHTNGLTIVASGASALRLGTNSLVIANGSGAVSLGNGGGNSFPVALVLGAGSINFFTNNSAYPATINSDVNWTMGGGNLHFITLCGSGSWNINCNWAPVNNSGGSQDQMIINCAGTVTYAPTNLAGITYAAPFSGITLNSGTFKLGNAYCLTNLSGALTLNGGTFDINGFSVTNNLSGAASINTSAVGGTPTLTVSNGTASTFSGVIKNTQGTLSLSKLGTGTLTLSGNNTYSGTTTVNAGTLVVIGSIGSGPGTVNVVNGAGLGGSGTVNAGINWQSGSSALFTVTNSGGANPLYLKVTGSLTLNTNAVTINVPGATPLPIGTYTLVNATGGSSGQFVASITSANYTGAGVAAGTLSTISTSGGVATLSVTAAGTATTWITDLAGGTGDWLVGANWTSNPYSPTNAGDTATLGVGSAVNSVAFGQNIALGGITFTNSNSFIIADAGKTLAFDNFGGGATVTVSSGASNSIATAVSLKDKTAINVAVNTSLAVSGVISGTSGANTLTKSGNGTLVLSANNTYGPSTGSVGTVLGGGILELTSSHALGSGDLTNTANTTLRLDAAMTLANRIWITSGNTLNLDDLGNAATLSGGLAGGGSLTKVGYGPDVLSYSGAGTLGSLNVNSNILELAAGTITASGQLFVDNNGTLQVDSGATLNFNASGFGAIGNNAGTTSTNIVNGILNYNNANVVVGRNGSGYLIINGNGLFSCNSFFDGQNAAGEIGTVILNGGTLLVNNVQASGSSLNNFYFNGGTLAAKGSNTAFWANSALIAAYVRTSPGTISNGGFNITIDQPINSETGNDGGMIFKGSGVTTLTATHGYNGPTTVNAGTLMVNGSIGSGNVTVASGAALGGTGTVGGNVNWQTGSSASFSLTNNGSGNGTPLYVSGNVTLNNNSVKINVLGSSPLPVGVYDLMYSSGISGSFAATPTFTGAGVAGGTVSTISISGGTATLTVLLGGNTWTHDGNGNWSTAGDWSGNPVIPRLPGDSALFGVGTAFITATLDTNVSVGGISFTNPNSFLIANAGKTLTITNTGGSPAINVSSGTSNSIAAPVILNGTVLVSETSGGGLEISSGLSGAGGLTIGGDGTGLLTLAGSNTYSGFTSFSAGILTLGSTNAIGTNALVIYGGILDSLVTNLVNANNNPQIWVGSFGFAGANNLNLGTGNVTVSNALTLSVTNTLVVGGTINAGSLTLTLNGSGTLKLDGNNAIGGVNSGVGVLAFGNDYAAGTGILNAYSPTAAFASSSSATRTIHNILGTGNGAFGWIFSGTGNLIFDGGVTSYNFNKTVTVNNPVTTWSFALPSGAAATTKMGAGTFILAGSNGNTGGNIVTEGTLALANSGALGTGPLIINGGNLDSLTANLTNINNNAQTWNTNFSFLGSQNLDLGNGAVTMAANVTVTVNSNTLTIAGAMDDGGLGRSLGLAGSGTLALSGANTYTGNTTVHGGTLELAQSAPTLATSSTVSIASGAHLKLNDSTVTNVVTTLVLSGVTNAPGVYGSANSYGYITGAGHLEVLTGPAGPTGPGFITNNFSGSMLSLSWPAGQGWRLQAQTNSLTTGLGTNWIYTTDGSSSSTNMAVDASKPTVFYRLTYP